MDIALMAREKVLLPSKKRPTTQEINMRKTILGALGAILVAASLMQTAVAAEQRHVRYADRAPVSASQQFRNANNQVAMPSIAEQDFEYWQGRGLSAGGPSSLRFRGNFGRD